MVAMPDGVKLATDLYFPADLREPLPVILIRTPYKKEMEELEARYFARRGYVVAVQDVGPGVAGNDVVLRGALHVLDPERARQVDGHVGPHVLDAGLAQVDGDAPGQAGEFIRDLTLAGFVFATSCYW